MNIDQLKYFADLAKTNSITNTAKRMFISQQALSESIKRLENEV
ncbi:MAG: LysR family transcriptional regulator, partial [Peptococcaceae bacterium]|nr:LysR family transcriptional regulator [Peptococcaceae bacterium]